MNHELKMSNIFPICEFADAKMDFDQEIYAREYALCMKMSLFFPDSKAPEKEENFSKIKLPGESSTNKCFVLLNNGSTSRI